MPQLTQIRCLCGRAALLLVVAVSVVGCGSGKSRARVARIRVGDLALTRCATAPTAYCGSIQVPLDWSRVNASPTITLAFRWLPATGTRARGTVMAVEGGPGYSSIDSQADYVSMLGPLTRTRNLLLVDLRGSGASDAIDCSGLEHYTRYQRQYGAAFDRLVGQCGRQLDHTWRYRGGSFVYGSEMFNTAYAAKDVARLLTLLDPGRVDLYGDSYGSWFAQVFALRYPAMLRSLTLDSTYQLIGIDPWYSTSADAAKDAFNASCDDWPACSSASGRASWSVIGALARRLRRAPVAGATTTVAGKAGHITVNVETLVNLVNNAGFDPLVYRDLVAAARALVEHNFKAPLLRLAALSIAFDDGNEALPMFSDGLYFAASCTDYAQLFDRRATSAVRERELAAALRAEDPQTFSPFTVREWVDMSQYNETYSACIAWPRAHHLESVIVGHPSLVAHRLRVLVLSGSLDSLTPREDGAAVVARALNGAARLVTVANLTHVVLDADDASCPTSIYRRFLRDPNSLLRLDTSCAPHVAPVHVVGVDPVNLAQVAPVHALAGNRVGVEGRKLAAVALAAVGDEISRWEMLTNNYDRGLLGGRVTFNGMQVIHMKFIDWRPMAGVSVNGTVTWIWATGRVRTRLTVDGKGIRAVELRAAWNLFAHADQQAQVHGRQGSEPLRATTWAP